MPRNYSMIQGYMDFIGGQWFPGLPLAGGKIFSDYLIQTPYPFYRGFPQLKGRGIISGMRNIGRKILSKLSNVEGLTDLFAGERHLPMANFLGPGTKIEKRVARGDVGVSAADKAAKIHDLDYSKIAKMMKDDENYDFAKDVREADKKFLSSLEKGKKTDKSRLNKVHTKMAKAGIKLKLLGEDLGVLSRKKYIGSGLFSKIWKKLKDLFKTKFEDILKNEELRKFAMKYAKDWFQKKMKEYVAKKAKTNVESINIGHGIIDHIKKLIIDKVMKEVVKTQGGAKKAKKTKKAKKSKKTKKSSRTKRSNPVRSLISSI